MWPTVVPMTLYVPGHLLETIRRHATSSYPEECCGFLIGSEQEGFRVKDVIPAKNVATGSRSTRYVIDPSSILQAERSAASSGMMVIGYYHSHPDHPSVPSEFDRSHAWPSCSYFIVRVVNGEPADFRSWRMTEEGGRFSREVVEIV